MKKINKLLMTSAIFASVFFSFTTNAQVSVKNFAGPSVEVGVQATKTKLTLVQTYDGSDDGLSQNNTNYLKKLSAQYGFETSINNLVIGLGASYALGNATVHFVDCSCYDEFAKLKNAMSVYIEPTYVLNDTTAVFGKLSYNRVNSTVYFYGDDPDAADSKTISGRGIGVGVTHFLTKDLFLKAEIESVHYGNNTYDGYDPYAAKTKQTNSTISLGVKF